MAIELFSKESKKRFMKHLVKLLALITKQQLILPFYHAVSNNPPLHLKHLYPIRSEHQFRNDLDFLLKVYEPISINQLVRFINGERTIPKYAFLLSFDDGLSEFAANAWPILKEKNIPATLFVNPGFVENKSMFFRLKISLLIEQVKSRKNIVDFNQIKAITKKDISNNASLIHFLYQMNYHQQLMIDDLAVCLGVDFFKYLEKHKPYLTLNELQNIAADGVCIGAHSMDHPLFNQLSEDKQFNQFAESVTWVKNNIVPEFTTFSFPFTDFAISQKFFKSIKESPLEIDLTFGTAGLKKDSVPFHFQRIPIEKKDWVLEKTLLFQYVYFLLKAPFFRNTIRR